jgi:hypothetical protein
LAPANKAKVGGVDCSTAPLTACLLSFRPTACGKPLELDFFLTASAKPSELLYSFTEYSGTILYSVFSMSAWLSENQI